MGYIIIKLYTNEMQGDIHDINIDSLNLLVEEMRAYAERNGKKLYFAGLTTDKSKGVPVDCDPFAEIEYTASITDDEKKRYVEFLKKLSLDADVYEDYLDPFNTLKMVKFKKIEDEIVEIL